MGKKPQQAVQAIVSTATQLGYLQREQHNVISLTIISEKPELMTEMKAQVRAGTDEALEQDGVTSEVIEQAIGQERRLESEELRSLGINVSAGKLNLIARMSEAAKQAAEAAGSSGKKAVAFNEAMWYGASVRDIQKQTNAYRAKNTDMQNTDKQGNSEDNAEVDIDVEDSTDDKSNDNKNKDEKNKDDMTIEEKSKDKENKDEEIVEEKSNEVENTDNKYNDNKITDPMTNDPKTNDPKTNDPKTNDPKTNDPKTDDTKNNDSKTKDNKNSVNGTEGKGNGGKK